MVVTSSGHAFEASNVEWRSAQLLNCFLKLGLVILEALLKSCQPGLECYNWRDPRIRTLKSEYVNTFKEQPSQST